jgi:PAS domain-containing protein
LYLAHIFRTSPLMGLALCVCLGTILWCILLTRRQQNQIDRAMTGLLGIIAIYEALRVLKDSGVGFFWHLHKLDGWADFLVATLCLIAALILKLSSLDRTSTKARLRLVEANEKQPKVGWSGPDAPQEGGYLLFDVSPLATFAVDSSNSVIYWNSSAEDLFGWKREEVLGQPLPFDGGEIVNKRGRRVEAAMWTAPIRSTRGASRATLTIAAGKAALRSAGLASIRPPSDVELALTPERT